MLSAEYFVGTMSAEYFVGTYFAHETDVILSNRTAIVRIVQNENTTFSPLESVVDAPLSFALCAPCRSIRIHTESPINDDKPSLHL